MDFSNEGESDVSAIGLEGEDRNEQDMDSHATSPVAQDDDSVNPPASEHGGDQSPIINEAISSAIESSPVSDSEASRPSSSGDSVQSSDVEENVYLPNQMTDAEKERYLVQNLEESACCGVSKSKVDDLLKRLNPVFPSVPRSYKTLLKPPRVVDGIKLSDNDGEIWYKAGLRNCGPRADYGPLKVIGGPFGGH